MDNVNNNSFRLPSFLNKYFWGDDLSELDWDKHQKYIISVLLEKGDEKAVSWLLGKIDKLKLHGKLSSLSLSPKSNNFWRQYLS